MRQTKKLKAFLHTPECASRVACDGNYLTVKRQSKGITICARCEAALATRGKVIGPRGVNCPD